MPVKSEGVYTALDEAAQAADKAWMQPSIAASKAKLAEFGRALLRIAAEVHNADVLCEIAEKRH